MKTIFIALLEGVEAKNILRSHVVDELLTSAETRVVLLLKNKERMAYYQKEFNHPRLLYQVICIIPVTGLDRFFSWLKFMLLRTKSTDQKRKMNLAEKGNYLSYYVGIFFNRLLARPFFIRLARTLDYRLVLRSQYRQYFELFKPDLVFLAHPFDEPEIHLLREAKRRGVKTVGLINSWDKATSRAILRLLPDKIIVFNETVKKEMLRYQALNTYQVFVSGQPQYDYFFNTESISRIDFFKKFNFDPAKKLLVYAPMGNAFSDSDWLTIDLIARLNSEQAFGDKLEILVRFQPNDFVNQDELSKRAYFKYQYPGKRFSTLRGVDWDMDRVELDELRDTLANLDILICHASSLSVDAVCFGKPVINIGYEMTGTRLLSKSPTQYFLNEHYKKALSTGGIKLVKTEVELISAVKTYLLDSEIDREGRERLLFQQCQFTDGRSAARIASYLMSII